jgi:hypothetical protein
LLSLQSPPLVPKLANLGNVSTNPTERRKTKRGERQDVLANRQSVKESIQITAKKDFLCTFVFWALAALRSCCRLGRYRIYILLFVNSFYILVIYVLYKPPYVCVQKKCFLWGNILQICILFRFIDMQKCPIPMHSVASLILSSLLTMLYSLTPLPSGEINDTSVRRKCGKIPVLGKIRKPCKDRVKKASLMFSA